jgi:4-hydroxybenzoate polyprenyltransferase
VIVSDFPKRPGDGLTTTQRALARPAFGALGIATSDLARPAQPERKGPARAAVGLLLASHPMPCLTVTAVITALAAASGRGAGGAVLVAAAILTGHLSVGWSNDRIDLARDIAAGRTDKPLIDGTVSPRTVSIAATTAVVLCIPLSLANGLAAGAMHLIGVGAAWTYNFGVKRTWLSPLPYAIGFGLLPAFVTLALPGHPWPQPWATAAAALLGVGAHASNVLPDIEDDLGMGVRGLPQLLGPGLSRLAAAGSLLIASLLLVFGPEGSVGVVGWVGLGVCCALALVVALISRFRPTSRLPFMATLGLAVLDVALLLLRGGKLT